MSTYVDDFEISMSIAEAMNACKRAVSSIGWKVVEESDGFLEVKGAVSAFSWAPTVEILCAEKSGITEVTLKGKNVGFGPIQSKAIKSEVGTLRNKIDVEVTASLQKTTNSEAGLTAELTKLVSLNQVGALSDEEFKQAKKKILGLD